jgi:hypothetical protein
LHWSLRIRTGSENSAADELRHAVSYQSDCSR